MTYCGTGNSLRFILSGNYTFSWRTGSPIADADVIIQSFSHAVTEKADQWISCHMVKLTIDEKGKACTDAVGLTGTVCDLKVTVKKGMIY